MLYKDRFKSYYNIPSILQATNLNMCISYIQCTVSANCLESNYILLLSDTYKIMVRREPRSAGGRGGSNARPVKPVNQDYNYYQNYNVDDRQGGYGYDVQDRNEDEGTETSEKPLGKDNYGEFKERTIVR